MHHGHEAFCKLVVAGGDTTEVLQLGEEALDQVPLSVEPCAEVGLRAPIGLGRDIDKRAFLAKRCPAALSVMRLIRQRDCSSPSIIEQTVGSLAIMALPGTQAQQDREALPVDDGVDFGREYTSEATETMISIPLLPSQPVGAPG